jgi:hypothetical protein
MTVRVNKDSFNIREKLSELERPIGLKGNELMSADTAQEARDFISAGRKNLIINGATYINQRNGTSSYVVPNATGGSYGGPDRWAVNEATGATISVNVDGDPTSNNALGSDVREFSKAFQFAVTSDNSSLSSNENLHFFQNIEGYNTAHLGWGTEKAKPVTLSFWVRSNVPGTYCVGLENNAVNKTCIREYTVDPGFKWQKVALTFPGPTDGTWERTNSIGIRVRFCLASGTQFDDGIDGQWVSSDELTTGNQVNFVSSTSNRYFITGVQIEVGKNATEFEHRFYNDELALCQRYYQKIYYNTSDYPFGYGYIYNTTSSAVVVPLPNSMRPVGAINFANLRIRGGGNNSNDQVNISGLTFASDNGSKNGLCQLNVTHSAISSTTQTIGATCVLTNSVSNSTAYLEINSEL